MQSAREEIRDLERVRYVTANYERLQGLRVVPLGIVFLVLSALTLLRLDVPGIAFEEERVFLNVLLFFGGVLGLLAALSFGYVIGGRYEQLYGKTRRPPLRGRTVVLFLLAYVSFEVAHIADIALRTPVYLPYLLLGVVGTVFWWRERRFRVHYLICAVSFLIVGLLPSLGVLPRGYFEQPGLLFSMLGLFSIVIGLADHRLLTKTMKSLPEENVDAVR